MNIISKLFRFIMTKGEQKFTNSISYWEDRYKSGSNSGGGSYGRLALFKAKIINKFLEENNIVEVLELGCGDGNQLQLLNCKKYYGFDVSKTIINSNIEKFKTDNSKSFIYYDPKLFCDSAGMVKVDLALSLDVIYHLVENNYFELYMNHLFAFSNKFVLIYSTNEDTPQINHEKNRNFEKWINENIVGWKLINKIENEFPFKPTNINETSNAQFFVYQKIKL